LRTHIHENQYTGSVTAEADSKDAAVAALRERLGPMTIEAVGTVRRGGVGGFFAKERVTVRARPASPAEAAEPFQIAAPVGGDVRADEIEPAVAGEVPSAFGEALSAALFGTREDDLHVLEPASAAAGDEMPPRAVGPFAGGGRSTRFAPIDDSPPWERRAASQPAADPAGSSDQPAWRLEAPTDTVVPDTGPVAWAAETLIARGMPKVMVAAARGLDERDDLGWINAIAGAIAPHVGPLPDGPTVYVGDVSSGFSDALGLPFVEAGRRSVPRGSFATEVPDEERALRWLDAVAKGRNLHLVVGEVPWLHLLVADPAGVSFSGDASVVDALYVALTLGARLGYGPDGGGGLARSGAIETALAVRRLVGRR